MRLCARPGVEVIAHRGASAARPEHTHAAYELALAQGADALELDLRATADGEVVVLHDATLGRTHGDPRSIAGVRLDELPEDSRPLTLASVLSRYGQATRLLLELKGPRAPIDAVVAAVADARLHERVVVQSFDPFALRRARRLDSELALCSLHLRRPSQRRLDGLAGWASAVAVAHGQVDAALVGRAHARGLGVRAYTPNLPSDLARLAALGVDGLITDVPDQARAALGAARLAA